MGSSIRETRGLKKERELFCIVKEVSIVANPSVCESFRIDIGLLLFVPDNVNLSSTLIIQ